MSADDSPYSEDTSESYGDDGPYDDNDSTGSVFPYVWPTWGGGGGWRLGWPSRDQEVVDEEARDETSVEEDDSWLGEGLFSLLVIVGVILFIFPEPATSMLGVILIFLGAVGWLVSAVV